MVEYTHLHTAHLVFFPLLYSSIRILKALINILIKLYSVWNKYWANKPDTIDTITMSTLKDTPLCAQLLDTDWTSLRIMTSLLSIICLLQVLKIQQLSQFLLQICLTATFVSHKLQFLWLQLVLFKNVNGLCLLFGSCWQIRTVFTLGLV